MLETTISDRELYVLLYIYIVGTLLLFILLPTVYFPRYVYHH